jgi:hypothetical protein
MPAQESSHADMKAFLQAGDMQREEAGAIAPAPSFPLFLHQK